MSHIIVTGAREGNLKNLSVQIPRNKLVVLTGLSGSGKTTLAVDVIFQECQRQYLEAMGLQGINKPNIDSIRNVSPAILITQADANKNPRSTVGTVTNIYTDLRMVFEKLSIRTCPGCHEVICAADCKEEVEKSDGDFKVYMYCNHCNTRIEKLTRTHFSHNTREGACKTCEGLGKVLTINKEHTIHEDLSPEDGAVDYWEQKYKEYQISSLYSAFNHYGISITANTPIKDFSDLQKSILYHGIENDEIKKAFPGKQPPKTVVTGKFEGVFPTLWRRMSDKGGDAKQINQYFDYHTCPDCKGERLNELSRGVTVEHTRLPELSTLSLEELYEWIQTISSSTGATHRRLVEVYLLDLGTKIQRLIKVGLGYLSLDRQTITLSGGELQRLKLAATLDSDLTGVIYIMDEPTVGLHPKDTQGMIAILKKLRDLGNTVIVIEHDPDIMQEADYIIDIGPGSGKHGGNILGVGTLGEIMEQEASITGIYLRRKQADKKVFRAGNGNTITISSAILNNLKNINVTFPVGCLIAITGVSGSGKSTLVFDLLADGARTIQGTQNKVSGTDQFDQIVKIEQSAITKMKRSNVATYSEVYSEIRKIFGKLPEAKQKGLSDKYFSFNTPGGRCENCEGLGYISSNMLFFKNADVVCPVCNGNQFIEDVISVTYNGYSIKDILKLSVEEALELFQKNSKIMRILSLLEEVGLGYLELGQTLTTLSGGEGQRLKLAKELISNTGQRSLYLMDEPTTGLHPVDVEHFLLLLNRMVDSGNTVIIVEHNQQVIKASDWIIDLGPEGGKNGGEVMFTGTPLEMIMHGETATAECLRRFLPRQLC
ncbi:MAG: transporter related [Herbinix sp.]|jgi:excinuclease ABC subunit A|nr:transporter related [Herbinix sp.]